MDPFRLCLALGPLAVYSLCLAMMHLSRRAWVVNGTRDLIALGVGVAGFVLIGPIELILPVESWTSYRVYAWIVVLVIYGVTLTLVALLGRPRITVYNIPAEVFRAVLSQAASALDPRSRWAGNSLVMPQLDVELNVEAMSPMQTVTIVATHEEQQLAGWRTLESTLVGELRKVQRPRNPWGYLFLSVALLLGSVIVFQLVDKKDEVVQGFHEMLRLD